MSIAGPARRELNLSDLVSDRESQDSRQDFYDPEKEIDKDKKKELAEYVRDLIKTNEYFTRDIVITKSIETALPNYYTRCVETDEREEYASSGIEQTKIEDNKINWSSAPYLIALLRNLDPEAAEKYRPEIDFANIGVAAWEIEMDNMCDLINWARHLEEAFPDINFMNEIERLKNIDWQEYKNEVIESLKNYSDEETYYYNLEALASLRVVFSDKEWTWLDNDLALKAENVLSQTKPKRWYLKMAESLKILTAQEVKLTDKGVELIMPSDDSYENSNPQRPERIQS